MLKAGSLLYAVFIALIISTLIASFISYTQYSNRHIDQNRGRLQALSYLASGMAYLKADTINQPWSEKLLLFENEIGSNVELSSDYWGVFPLIEAKSWFKRDTFYKAAVAGYSRLAEYSSTVLYLANHNQALALAGHSRINGDAYLSSKGVKRAYIEGRSFYGKNMLSGKQHLSKRKAPSIASNVRVALNQVLNSTVPRNVDSVIHFKKLGQNIILNRSFRKTTLGVYGQDAIDLNGGELKGRIVVKSASEIYIGSNLKTEDIVFVAPKITVESGFKGSLQLIASDSIIIGKNCTFTYPSSIAINYNGIEGGYIELGEQSVLYGDVMLLTSSFLDQESLLTISKGAKVVGNVYSAGKLQVKGSVLGTAIADKLYLKQNLSVYENHLLDGVLDVTERPNEYLSSGIIEKWDRDTKEIIKWLD